MIMKKPITAPMGEEMNDKEMENTIQQQLIIDEESEPLIIKNEKDIRKLDYKIEKFTLTADNVNDFVILLDRRKINDGQVKKIHGALIEKKNPIGILIVNRVDGKNRLIDGNHRIEAIKRYFEYRKIYATVKIDCSLKVYENLTPDEERQLYLDEAKRRNESLEDRLNMFKSTITVWKLLTDPLNPFPCDVSIYNSANGLKFKIILNALASARRGNAGFGTIGLDKDSIIYFANDVKFDEFKTFKDFMNLFIKLFGKVEKSNDWIRTHYFISLYDIYVTNIHYKDDKSFDERFKSITGRADLLKFINMSGREAMMEIRKLMLEHMNKGRKTRMFE